MTQSVANDRWFISDLHLGHAKLLESRGFASVDEMDSTILGNIVRAVQPSSILYVLGDVAVAGEYKWEHFQKLKEINCRKILIAGNHDFGRLDRLGEVFEAVFGAYHLAGPNWILTHFPIHPRSLFPRFAANLHGHTHMSNIDDPHYVNLSVEVNGYAPVHYAEIKARLLSQEAR